MSPMDANFVDLADDVECPYPHKLTLLRHELIELFYDHKYRAYLKDLSDKVWPSVKNGSRLFFLLSKHLILCVDRSRVRRARHVDNLMQTRTRTSPRQKTLLQF
jgi:hypothetical protein